MTNQPQLSQSYRGRAASQAADDQLGWRAEEYADAAFQRKYVSKWFGERDKDR